MMRITRLASGGVRAAPLRSRVHVSVRCRLQQPPSRLLTHACDNERVLRASLAAIGGGMMVTTVLLEMNARRSNFDDEEEEEDSWSGFFRSSIAIAKRAVEKELQDDNKKALAGLIAANTAVFALWRVSFNRPGLERIMWRHFACSYTAVAQGKRLHTLLTSAFSHITVPHFGINMFMLWEFGRHILAPSRQDTWYERAMGKSRVVEFFRRDIGGASRLQLDKFMLLYFGSVVASSALSVVLSNLRGTPGVFTIGASGAVMGVFTVYCLLFPKRELMLYGFYNITAADALKLTTAMNLVGSAFQRNLSIDCVGHIGGQTTGLVLNETSMLA
ncbi:hypothetical protein PybrP1_009828 [[Pythium] brassicae (nom. inval.)]|nr:hypothetical protein PybrP1_009828 [[Pythium] brassicae (nom. inval.)]